MAITHSGNQLTITDGVETWNNLVAYCQSNSLTTITQAGAGTGAFVLSGPIFVADDAKLVSLSISLRVGAQGGFYTIGSGSATIEFGELVTVSGKTIARNGCNIGLSGDLEQTAISYAREDRAGGEVRQNLTKRINFYGSSVLWHTAGDRKNLFISRAVSSRFIAGLGGGDRFLYTQPGAVIRDCSFEALATIEMVDAPAEFNGNRTQEMFRNFLNWQSGGIILIRDFESIGATNDFWSNNGGFRFIDSSLRLESGNVQNGEWRSQKAYSVNLQFTGSLAGVRVRYTNAQGDQYNAVSDAAGRVPELVLITQQTVGSGDPVGSLQSFSPFDRHIRKYGYKFELDLNFEIDAPLGRADAPFVLALSQDSVARLSEAAALALTGIEIDHAARRLTLTQTRSIRQIYDHVHAHLSQSANLSQPEFLRSQDGASFICDYDLAVDGCTLSGSGTVTLPTKTLARLNGGSVQPTIEDINGVLYRVFGLPTNAGAVLRVKRISTGAVINPPVVGGEATLVLVPGEDYEVRGDAIGYRASKFLTINSNNSAALEILLDQLLDRQGNPVYGQGNPVAKNLITFNPFTLTIEITYSPLMPTIDAYSTLDRIEELLATPLGLEFTAHPIWDDGKLVFPRDLVSGQPNPARIQAAANNEGIPELLFELEHEGHDRPYRLFDVSNGKTINYPTTVNLATGGGGGGSIDAESVGAAVLGAIVESELSVQQVLRLLLAVSTGKTSITPDDNGGAVVRFRDVADSKDRVVATMDGSERIAIIRDAT